MIHIRVDVPRQQYERIRKSLREFRPFFESEGSPLIYSEIRKVFDTEGYGSWPPLSPAYARWKRIVAPGKKMLRLTDAYFQSATSSTGIGSVYRVSERHLKIGVDSSKFRERYPTKHEAGIDVPARPVFEIAAERVIPQIATAFQRYVFRRIRR